MVPQSGHPLDGSSRHLEGVLSKIYPFCKGTGFFMLSRRQIPPFYAITQNPKNRSFLDTFGTILDTIILPFSRRGSITLEAKSGHSNSQKSVKNAQFDSIVERYTFLGSRQRSIKTTRTFWQNYEYNGHSLDTIMAQFFPSQKGIFATFIVTILHTCGHYNKIPKSSDLAKKAK